MNHQRYYQGRIPANVQEISGQLHANIFTNAAGAPTITGGLHVTVPPPPPPVSQELGTQMSMATTTLSNDNTPQVDESKPEDTTETNKPDAKKSNVENTEDSASLVETSVISSTKPDTAPAALMGGQHSSGLIGGVGVYAGAYFQQAIPQYSQQPLPQYPLQQTLAPAAASKCMMLPQAQYQNSFQGLQYAPASSVLPAQQMMLTDHTGKTYLVNNPYQPQVQYVVPPVAPTVKANMPGVQLMMQPQPALNSAMVHPLYGRQQIGITPGQNLGALGGAVPGMTPNLATNAATGQLYYYYY